MNKRTLPTPSGEDLEKAIFEAIRLKSLLLPQTVDEVMCAERQLAKTNFNLPVELSDVAALLAGSHKPQPQSTPYQTAPAYQGPPFFSRVIFALLKDRVPVVQLSSALAVIVLLVVTPVAFLLKKNGSVVQRFTFASDTQNRNATSILSNTPGADPQITPVRFQISLPTPPSDANFSMSLSPDGRKLVYIAPGAEGRRVLWIRDMDTLESRWLPGTENGVCPFWSPDSRYLAFGVGTDLKRIDVSGSSPPLTICKVGYEIGTGSWNADGVIVFGSRFDFASLDRVSASGGTPTEVTALVSGDRNHAFPFFLPDGKHFIYSRNGGPDNSGTYVGSLDAKPTEQSSKRLLSNTIGAAFAPSSNPKRGYLLFLRGATLMAQPFDLRRLELAGAPVSVAEHIPGSGLMGWFSVSANGTLAYRAESTISSKAESTVSSTQLAWYDRTGNEIGTMVGGPVEAGPLALSPDGKLAVVRNGAVLLIDQTRSTDMRLHFGSAKVSSVVWSPDGTHILFGLHEGSEGGLFAKAVNSSAGPDLMLKTNGLTAADSWSRDGRFVLYDVEDASGKSAIWELPLAGDKKPIPVVKGDFRVRSARLSPDGKWMAYVSNESGRDEVYVQGFPPPAGKWAISAGGGMEPEWREDGQELFFLSADGMLMATEMKAHAQVLRAGIPRPLFVARRANVFAAIGHGKVFLMPESHQEQESDSINVVLNWPIDLAR
jgi:Tol biopolymer transport system component